MSLTIDASSRYKAIPPGLLQTVVYYRMTSEGVFANGFNVQNCFWTKLTEEDFAKVPERLHRLTKVIHIWKTQYNSSPLPKIQDKLVDSVFGITWIIKNVEFLDLDSTMNPQRYRMIVTALNS